MAARPLKFLFGMKRMDSITQHVQQGEEPQRKRLVLYSKKTPSSQRVLLFFFFTKLSYIIFTSFTGVLRVFTEWFISNRCKLLPFQIA